MDLTLPIPLLGGLTPTAFMRRHWQKKPLLIRGALPGGGPVVSRAELFALAAEEAVESRLVVHAGATWSLRHGPFKRGAFPPLKQPRWTLLVQGMDLHLDAARALLERFRFVPDARLDDVMVSYASDGGGVGPHVDSYDVFLLQVQGRRRWGVGRVTDPALVPDVPLKILAHFTPEVEWLLEPGDMLYLPPGWGHDGVAEGECLTCSIGFRAAGRDQLARDVLQRALDGAEPVDGDVLYRDPRQPATDEPGRIPGALLAFAADAASRTLADPRWLGCALGEVLSEPKPGVWFDTRDAPTVAGTATGVRLDRRSRMLYDDWHVFINGESFQASGRDATLMRRLADRRSLALRETASLSAAARELLDDWLAAGWLLDDAAARNEGGGA
jgi:50S ribosomal protein L16 3-hydroxylase